MDAFINPEQDLELQIGAISIRVVAVASAIIIALILYAVITKNRSGLIFVAIVTVTLLSTIFLVGSTIYLNAVSSSKGPVHWHADYEVWNCDNELELIDPQGFLSNKVGTPVLHEHDDKRIHLEGVVVHRNDASLGKYFRVIGGELTKDTLTLPTNNGKESMVSGQDCDGQPAQLQTFIYRMNDDGETYTQTKLDDPASHIIKDESQVPPGDCLIFELSQPKDRTDKMCLSWEVAKDLGDIKEQPL